MFLFSPALKNIVQGEELKCITWIHLAQTQTSFYVQLVIVSMY